MNKPIILAQAENAFAQLTTNAARIVRLAKPADGQAHSIALLPDQNVVLDMSGITNDKITLVRVGTKLIILFDNQSTLVVDPAYDNSNSLLGNITFNVGDGRTLDGTQFAGIFPISDDQSVLPAAGDGGNAPAGGANFTDPNAVALGDDGGPLDLLGNEDFEPFTIAEVLDNLDPPDVKPEAIGEYGVVRLLERHLDLDQDADDLGPGDTTGTDGADANNRGETVQLGGVIFRAGSEAITVKLENIAGLVVKNEAGTAIALVWTLSPDGARLEGFLPGNGPLAIIVEISGPLAAGPFNDIEPTLTVTLTTDFPHSDTSESGGDDLVTIEGLEVVATDLSGDRAVAGVLIEIEDDAPEFTADADQGLVDEDGVLLGNDGDSYPAFNPDGTASDVPGSSIQAQGSLNINWGADRDDSNDGTVTIPFIGVNIHRQDGVSLGDTAPNAGMGRAVWFSSATVLATIAGESQGEGGEGGNAIPVTLTSRGDEVTFQLIESGTRIVGWADGRLVMTAVLSDDGSGSYRFTLFDELDHFGGNAEDDLALTFNFTARDSDGDTIESTFTVTVNDDAPELGTATTATVDEDSSFFLNPGLPGSNSGGPDDVGGVTGPVGLGVLNIDWGADDSDSGPANRSVVFNGIVNGQAAAHAGGALTAGGDQVYLWVSADGTTLYGYTGTLADPNAAPPAGQRVFTVEVDDGTLLTPAGYSFKLNANLDHQVADTEDELLLTFGFKATDADGDSVIGSFSVSVDDDTPVIGNPQNRTVDEDGGNNQATNPGLPGSNPGGTGDTDAPTSRSGNLDIDWGADSDNDVANGGVNGAPVAGDRAVVFAAGIAAPASLSSNGFDIIYSVTGNGTLLTAYRFEGGSYWGPNGENLGANPSDAARVFTVSLTDTSSGSYTFTLLDNLDHPAGGNENEINLDFGFVAYDSDGDSATDSFRVTVDDDTLKFTAAAEQTTVDEDGLFRGNNGDSYPAFNPAGTAGDAAGAAIQSQGSLNISWGADAFDSNDSTATIPFIGVGIHRQDGVSLNATTPNDGMGRAVWFSSNAVEARDSDSNIVPLTSRGDEVTFQLIESGTRIVGWADGRLVMTAVLSDDGSGSYIFTLFDELDHNGIDVEDDLALKFSFTARDSDGDTVNSTFTVKVNDDAPELGTATTATVDEDGSFLNPGLPGDNPGGPGDAGFPAGPGGSGFLNIGWGADDGNSGAANRSVAFNGVVNGQPAAHAGGALTAGGQTVYLWVSADGTTLYGYTGTLADPNTAPPAGQRVFTVEVDDGGLLVPGGSYSFELNANLDHSVAGTEDELLLTFGFKATDADGDSVIGSFSVSVDDDTPVIGSPNDRTVDEDGGTNQVTNPGLPGSNPGGGASDANAGLTATQSLEIDWGADSDNNVVNGGVGVSGPVAGDRAVVFASSIAAPAGLSSNGFDITYAVTNNGTLLTAYRFEGGSYWGPNGENLGANPSDAARVFTVSLSDAGDGSYTFTLLDNLDHAAGNNENNLNLDFGFVAYDSDGDSATDSFRVIVDDDTPVKLGAAETESVNEDDLLLGNDLPKELLAQSGNLNIGWGADAGDARRVAFDPAVLPQGLFSNGDPVQYLITTDGNGNGFLLAYVDNAGGAANPLNWVFSVNLSDAASGSYTFTLLGNLDHADGAGENVMPLSFGVVAYDSDGDPVKQTFTVDVTDDTPLVLAPQNSTVEEEQAEVAGDGIDDTSPGEDGDFTIPVFNVPVLGITTQTASATLGISWGADHHDAPGRNDGEGRSVYFTNLANAAANIAVTDGSDSFNATNLFSRGDLISYQLFDNGTRLEARASDGRLVFEVTLNDDGTVPALGGSYTFTLHDVLDHPDGEGENKYVFTFDFTAEDGDGDTAGGEFSVTVLDDKPGVPVITVGNGLIHDETTGVQSGNADADALGDTHNEDDVFDASGVFALAGFTPPPGTGAAIGYAQQGNAVTVVASYGGDGPGPAGTELSLTRANGADFTGQATNLFVSSGSRIYLFTDASGVVVGREGSGGSADANGDAAFALHIADDGTLTLVQYLPIRHNDTASNDEIIRLNAQGGGDVLFVTATSTDFDGDTATSTSSEGLNVRFDDDGPSILANDYNLAQRDFTLDEDDLPGGNNTPPTGQHNQTALLGKPLGVVWGADDGDTRDLQFTVATGATALKSGGDTIVYSLSADGHTLTAHTGDPSDPVFVVTLDPTSPSGAYDFTLYRPLDHADGAGENSIALDFTFDAYDGDGDKASSNIVIRVVDDVPLAPTVIVNPVSPSGTATLIHDETAGVQSGGPDTDAPGDVKPESDVASLPGIFSGLTVLATAGAGIGFAERTGAVTVTAHFGADGPGTVTTTLQLTDSTGATFDGDATNLFDTATGNRIFLYTDADSGIVVGRIGSGSTLGAADAGGDIAFAIAIDGDGKLSLVQYSALLDNPGTVNDRDDAVTLGAGGAGNNPILFVTATTTDFDKDPVTSAPQQLTIRFDDDGPTNSNPDRFVTVSEADVLANGSDTDSRTFNVNYGADGYGSTYFTGAMRLDFGGGHTDNNVTINVLAGPVRSENFTSDGRAVTFELIDANTIRGYVASADNGGAGDVLVLELKLTDTDSSAHVFLYQNVDHINVNPGVPLGSVRVDATIAFEDKDGDSVTGIVRATINDHGPSIGAPEAGVVTEDATPVALANADFSADSLAIGQPGVITDALGNYAHQNPSGWTISDLGNGGIYNPIPSIVDQGSQGAGTVVWLRAGAMLSQNTGEDLVEGANYTVRINVGDRTDQSWPGGEVRLIAVNPSDPLDIVTLATLDLPDPGQGQWTTVQLNSGPISAALAAAGYELRIEVQQDSAGGGQVLVDNVELVVTPPIVATGSLAVNWGADSVDNDGNPVDRSVAFAAAIATDTQVESANGDVTSNGANVLFVRVSETEIYGVADDDNDGAVSLADRLVFHVTLDDGSLPTDQGSYRFVLLDNLDHVNAGDENSLDLAFGFTATDADGDPASSSFKVTVNDDDKPSVGAQPSIANGDFTQGDWPHVEGWGVWDAAPQGWTVEPSDINGSTGDNIRLEKIVSGYGGLSTPNGAPMVDLGATPGNVRISQAVQGLEDGKSYVVEFLAGAPQPGSAGLQVFWGGVLIATIPPTSAMTSYSYVVTAGATPASNTLTFQETGSNDNHGTYLANIGIHVVVDEDDLSNGSDTAKEALVVAGSLNIDWGADDANPDGGTVDRTIAFTTAAGDSGLTSGGTTVHYFVSGETLIAYLEGTDHADPANQVFVVTLSDELAGGYSFTLKGKLDHPTGNGENVLPIVFGFTATDADGDPAAGSFTVAVRDDVPTAVHEDAVTIAEDASAFSGNVLANDIQGADGATLTKVSFDGIHFVLINTGTPNGGGFDHAIAGVGVYTFNANGDWTFDPAPDFNGSAGFSYIITDGDGDESDPPLGFNVEINVTPVNDAPVITIPAGEATTIIDGETAVSRFLNETNSPLTANGTLTVTDVDTGSIVSAQVVGISGGGASYNIANAANFLTVAPASIDDAGETPNNLTWTFDTGSETFDFLPHGFQVRLTYTVRVTDEHGLTDDQLVTVLINGTNDAPVITIPAGETTIDLSGETAVSRSLTETDAALTANGTLTVEDVDNTSVVSAQVVGISGGGASYNIANAANFLTVSPGTINDAGETPNNLTWTFNTGGETFDFLPHGFQVRLTYTVRVTDDRGATDDQLVTILVTGTNDAPEITIPAGETTIDLAGHTAVSRFINETDTVLVANGTLTVTDVDNGSVVGAQVVGISGGGAGYNIANALNFLTVAPGSINDAGETANNLTWTFNSGSETFDFLPHGNQIRLTYTIRVTDDRGATDEQLVSILINGTNDTPVIGGVTTGSVAEAGDIAGIYEAGRGGGLEPAVALNGTITTALGTLLTAPDTLNSVLGTVAGELGSNMAQAIAVVWDYLDDIYATAGPNQINVNEAFTRLGIEYATLLKAGSLTPLIDVLAKYTPDNLDADTLAQRVQSLHDNLLGNLTTAALTQRYGALPGSALHAELADLIDNIDPDMLTRPYYEGSQGESDAAVRQWDLDNGFATTASGQLTVSDPDQASGHVWTPVSATGTYGTFVSDATGKWTYTLNNADADTQALSKDQAASETFQVTVTDAYGATDTVNVVIGITGSNDAPVIESTSSQRFARGFDDANDSISSPGYGEIALVVDAAPAPGQYALVGEGGTGTGPFTNFGGYSSSWTGDWSTQVKVFLDATTLSDGQGFDWSVAANGTDGAHQRDFVFHVWKVDSQLYVAGSTGSPFAVNAGWMNSLPATDKFAVGASGWYTLEHRFINDGGVLKVELHLLDAGGTSLWNETLSDPTDTIPAQVGGSRYGWFTFVDVPGGVAVDGLSMEVTGAAAQLFELADGSPLENIGTHTATGVIAFSDVDGSGTHTASATLVSVTGPGTEPQKAALAGALTVSVDQSADTVAWTYTGSDAAADYLAQGETATVIYRVTVDDGDGGVAYQNVTVTITGSNDTPVISGVSQPIALVNAGFEADASYNQSGSEGRWSGGSPAGWTVSSSNGGWFDPGPAGPAGADGVLPMETDNGTNVLWLNDGVTASQTLAQTAATGTYELTFEVGDRRDANLTGTPDFVARLYAGATLISELIVPATMADGAAWTTLTLQGIIAAGSPAIGQPLRIEFQNLEGVGGNNDFSQMVQINIDNVALAFTATGAHLVEGNAGLTANGVLNVTDVDVTDIVNVTVNGVSATGPTNGLSEATLKSFLTLSPQPVLDGTETADNVNWTFDSLGEAFNFLAAGQTLTLTYALIATDDSGAANDTSAPFNVTITITGTDDVPVIGGTLTDTVNETGDIAGIYEAGRGGGLEPVSALTETVTDALETLLTQPDTLNTVLGTVAGALGGNMAQAIAVVWDYLDDIYATAGPNQINVNEAFTRLGIEYATLVKAGTLPPLTDVLAKYTPDNNSDADLLAQRVQSLHDNLLGNLTTAALTQRYGALPGSALHAELADLIDNVDPDLLTRAYYEGSQGDSDTAARQWDLDNGFVATASGQVVVTDVDGGSGTFAFSGNVSGAYGTFTVDPVTGEWTYVLDNQLTAIQQLALLDTAVETFSVTASDGSTTLTTQVTVTINGANDAPVIEASSTERFMRGFDNAGDSIPSAGFGTITLVDADDAGYIPSSAGGGHALFGENASGGPFTNFGGYSSQWTGDWSTQVKVWLNTGLNDGEGFDWSVATTGADGNHQRDFIFHVWKVDGHLYVGGSNNTDFSVNAGKMNNFSTADKYAVGTDGWYTLEHRFINNGGVLAVELHLLDASGYSLWHETLSNPADTIPAEIGGNRYGWFTFVDGPAVAVDGVSMETSGSTAQVFELADGSPLENIALHTATGEIAFSDIDGSGTHTASATFLSAVSTGGPLTVDEVNALKGTFSLGAVDQGADTVGWSYSAEDAGIDFLDAGETATVTYRVAIDDGHGGQAYQDVTVTVNGAQDAPPPSPDGEVRVYDTSDVLVATYASLQAAVGNVTTLDGYTVMMGEGTFAHTGTLNINKSLTIVGGGKDSTFIESLGTNTNTEGKSVTITAENVTFKNVSFTGWSDPTNTAAAGRGYLVWNTADGTTFDNVKFDADNIRVAVYIGTSDDITITGSEFAGHLYRYAIRGAGEHMEFTNNTFNTSHYEGGPIYMEYGAPTSGVISGNTFNHGYGVTVLSSDATGEFKSDGTLAYTITNWQPNAVTADGLIIENNDFNFVSGNNPNDVTGAYPKATAILNDGALPASGPIIIRDNDFDGYDYQGPSGMPMTAAGRDAAADDALSFDGANAYGTFVLPEDIGQQGTLSLWVQLDKLGTGSSVRNQILEGPGDGGMEFQYRGTSNGQFYGSTNGGDNNNFAIQSGSANAYAGGWTSVQYVWDFQGGVDSYMRIYINGVEVSYMSTAFDSLLQNWDSALNTAGGTFYLGRDPGDSGRMLDGRIDELAIFDAVLDQSQLDAVRTNAAGIDTTNYTSLVAYWNFDNVTGNTVQSNGGTNVQLQLHSLSSVVSPTVVIHGGTDSGSHLIGNTFDGDGPYIIGNGNERIGGTSGDDILDGGSGTDLLDLSRGTAGVDFTLMQGASDTTVDLTASGLGVDTYRNFEGVIGTDFDDTLNGGAASDILVGGQGNDVLTGNGGADIYAFAETGLPNADEVIGYSKAEGDLLDLSALLDANFDTVTDNVANFVRATDDGHGNAVVEVNLDGTGGDWEQVATLHDYAAGNDVLVRLEAAAAIQQIAVAV